MGVGAGEGEEREGGRRDGGEEADVSRSDALLSNASRNGEERRARPAVFREACLSSHSALSLRAALCSVGGSWALQNVAVFHSPAPAWPPRPIRPGSGSPSPQQEWAPDPLRPRAGALGLSPGVQAGFRFAPCLAGLPASPPRLCPEHPVGSSTLRRAARVPGVPCRMPRPPHHAGLALPVEGEPGSLIPHHGRR